MNNTIRGALLFATAIIAFAAPARAGAESRPSMAACIAYAEVDAAYDAAMKEPDAAYNAVMNRANAARSAAFKAAYYNADGSRSGREFKLVNKEADAAYNAIMIEPQAVYDAAKNKADAASSAVLREAEAAYKTAQIEADIVLVKAYFSIYKEDGGKQSSVESVMLKLIEHDRNTCQELYGI